MFKKALIAILITTTAFTFKVEAPAQEHKQVIEKKPTTQEITRDLPIEKMLECLGDFKLTAYCSCEKCCGKWALNRPNGIVYGCSGEELRAGYSIATDLEVLPLGTEVYIDGVVYKVQDCGGAVKGNHIDIYFDSHEEALRFNTRVEEVYRW